ncbi:hypothetical protein [Pseudoxanthomonas sp. GM95]|uniref:hypothetical protein n=1 Tax=Pseudoxanthomonas sp. GM95 TaxID=1881043 RepID=UPI0011140490|nr:hypothetical protein [Pseudoxanthomonas sp. GM95]
MGILPSLLIKVMAPELWMLWMARVGVVVTYAAWAPAILRGGFVLIRDIVHHRTTWIAQLDHDRPLFAELKQWLATYPREALQDHLQFAQHAQVRLSAKLGLLAGGAEKLGLLPAFIAALIALRSWHDLWALPSWLTGLGLFLVVTWVIGLVAVNMRLRIQLYEMLLADALKLQDATSVAGLTHNVRDLRAS